MRKAACPSLLRARLRSGVEFASSHRIVVSMTAQGALPKRGSFRGSQGCRRDMGCSRGMQKKLLILLQVMGVACVTLSTWAWPILRKNMHCVAPFNNGVCSKGSNSNDRSWARLEYYRSFSLSDGIESSY
jgi:hypothetical protein